VTVRRLIAIVVIFLGSSLAWATLASSLLARAGEFDQRLEQEVEALWGRPHQQAGPVAQILRPENQTEIVETTRQGASPVREEVTRAVVREIPLLLQRTRAQVDIDLEQRQRGLLWYPTYTVTFDADYEFSNPDTETRTLQIRFPLPAKDALLDDFVFSLDGRQLTPSADGSGNIVGETQTAGGDAITLHVSYRSRGMRRWTYAFAPSGPTQVRQFELAMRSSFPGVDFPAGTLSPDTLTRSADGAELAWRFENLIAGQGIGIEMPERINPGPFAARVTFFAPVSLLFFLTVMVIAGATSGPALHPMHYWFISAAFFAFHLLLAYLVDHVNLHVAFAVAALTSVALVVTYVRAIAGATRLVLTTGAAQIVFLVLFSYAFFLEGFTGLTITIGAIVTLFVLMQSTARVAWDEVLRSGTQITRVVRRAPPADSTP
jgi:inner membrane protein involved in colicin E2 resistance